MTDPLITMAEYARRRGVSKAAVSKAVRRCGIPLTGGKLDALVADTLWQARTDPDQQRRALGQQRKDAGRPAAFADPSGDPAARSWRDRKDRASALLEEMKLARERGALHDGQECLAGRDKAISIARQRLLAIPSKVAGQLPPSDQRGRIADLIEREIHAALHELAGSNPNE